MRVTADDQDDALDACWNGDGDLIGVQIHDNVSGLDGAPDEAHEAIQGLYYPATELPPKRTFVGLHHHRHGISQYVLTATRDLTVADFQAHLEEKFEPGEDEWLEITETAPVEVGTQEGEG